jgi:hypothetical protein
MSEDITKLPIDENDDSEITSSDINQFMNMMASIGIEPMGVIPVQIDIEKTKVYIERCIASMAATNQPNEKSCIVFKSLYRAIINMWDLRDTNPDGILMVANLILLLHYHRCGVDDVSHVLLLSNSPNVAGSFDEKSN